MKLSVKSLLLSFILMIGLNCFSFASNESKKTLSGFKLNNYVNPLSQNQDIEVLRQRAFSLIREGKWLESSLIFEKILSILPEDYYSLYGYGITLFNQKKIELADQNLNKAIKILSVSNNNQSLQADCLVLSAIIAANKGSNAGAVEKLRQAVKVAPDHFDANFNLGRAFYGNGNIADAVSSFEKAVKIQPANLRARFFLATSLEKLDEKQKALTEYREMLKINPENIEGNLGLGVLLIKLDGEKSEEGIAALEKVLSVNQSNYEAQITLGKSLLKLNRTEKAAEHLKKATELAPNNPEPHYQLALAYRRLGKKAEAKEEMEIVKRIHEQRRGVNNKN
jgi:tetratricopeptide (TPR) repeat protein